MPEIITSINPDAVEDAFCDCLFRPDEIIEDKVPDNAVLVEAIQGRFGFHPGRLQTHANEVRAWLSLLPHQFRKDGGGGWSFLNACEQADGEQWTGLHQRMDQLFALGIALGMARMLTPRDMWEIFPGGMPYLEILL